MLNPDQLKLYLVTDRSFLHGRDLKDVVLEAVHGGVTMVQIREKSLDTRTFINLAADLVGVLRPLGVPLIVNDRVDVALASDADGVHIGQSDMPYEMARRLLGKCRIIGLSVENFAQIQEANALDVDYLGVSPVFSTPTKTDTAAPFLLDGLRKAVLMSVHPTVAIGGVNLETLPGVLETGCDGAALVSAILSNDSPKYAAQRLRRLIDLKQIG